MSLPVSYVADADFKTQEKSALEPEASSGIEIGDAEALMGTGSQNLHRKLRGKEVQLFAIGGAIGTCDSPSILFYDFF